MKAQRPEPIDPQKRLFKVIRAARQSAQIRLGAREALGVD
jgi:hypothetical protein